VRNPAPAAHGRDELTDVRAPLVKAARRLLKRAYRAQDRAFLAEGVQAVREALEEAASRPGGPAIRQLFVTAPARERNPELVARAVELGVPVRLASGQVLTELSETVTPQGLAAVCELRDVPLGSILATAPKLIVVLAAVRDPGNAGTVLRTADAAGADAVIFADNSVDPYNGKCVRASAGSLFHLPVVAGVPVAAAIAGLRSAGLQVLAADGSATADLDELERAGDLAGPTAWVFGNEAWGLPADVIQAVDRAVAIPIHGRAESLNLAAAAAVCLYASARGQRSGHR
jgi:RNA methyltransferase, TrmH family